MLDNWSRVELNSDQAAITPSPLTTRVPALSGMCGDGRMENEQLQWEAVEREVEAVRPSHPEEAGCH